MKSSAILFCVAVLIVLACETPKSVAVPASSPATSVGTPAVAVSVDASAPASSRIRVESPFPGGVEIVNDSDAPVGILRSLPIERRDGRTWTAAHVLDMKQTCDAPPLPDCVSIPAHSRYAPLPWTGWLGCTQCGSCRGNAPAAAGTYRVVAVECQGGVRHEGPSLDIVAEGRFAGAPHVFSPKSALDAVQIDNDSDTAMSFNTELEVLQLDKQHNSWDIAPGAKMTLASTCGVDAGTCTTVPAHGSITSSAYRPGCAMCTKCPAASAKPGTYRFRVSVCRGSKPLYDEVYGYSFYADAFTVAFGGTVTPRP